MNHIKVKRDLNLNGLIIAKGTIIETNIWSDSEYITVFGNISKEDAVLVNPYYFFLSAGKYCTVMAESKEEAERMAREAGAGGHINCCDENEWYIKRHSPAWDAALYCGFINPNTKRYSIPVHEVHNLQRVPFESIKNY